MSDGKIIYDVEVNDDGIESKVQNTNNKIESAANTGSSAFGEIWTGALRRIGAGLVELGAKAVDCAKQVATESLSQVASLEQNIGGVQKLFGDSWEKVAENADQAFKTAGLSSNEYMETVTGFSASLIAGLDGDTEKAVGYADRAIRDMSDNANTFGTDMASIQTAYAGFAKQNYTLLDNLKLGYGGTKEEMAKLIKDASQMTTEMQKLGVSVDADSMSFDNIINAISVMQEHLSISGTTANEAADTIEGSVNSMKAAWDNFLAGTMDGEQFAEVALQAADNVVDAFMDIVPRLITGFAEMTPALLEKGREVVVSVATSIGEALPSIVEKGRQFVDNLGQGLVDGIPSITEKALQLVQSFTEFLASDGGSKLIQSGVDLLKNLVQGLANALPVLVQYIPQIILNIVTTIADNLPYIVDAAISMIYSLIDGIWQAVPKLLEQFPTIIKTIFTIWTKINWFTLGTTVISAICNGIAKVVSNIPNALKSIGNNAVNGFKSINWLSLGSNIISGIINGLSSGLGKVVDAAKNVAKSALNAAKSFLGIHSPSKVFEQEVGYQVDAGEAKGIEKNANLVEDAAKEVNEKALNASMDVNYNLPSTDSVSKDVGASFTSRLAQTVNRVIEVPLNISGREIARATAWDMGEQLAWESR